MQIELPCGCQISGYATVPRPEYGYSYTLCALHRTADRLLAFVRAVAGPAAPPHVRRLIDEAEGRIDEDGYPMDGEPPATLSADKELAWAVIAGQEDALFPLVDLLAEQGRLPQDVYKKSLLALVAACRTRGINMAEREDAEELLGIEEE